MPVYTDSARLINLLVAAAKSEAIEAMSPQASPGLRLFSMRLKLDRLQLHRVSLGVSQLSLAKLRIQELEHQFVLLR